jgi:hypothetical protein
MIPGPPSFWVGVATERTNHGSGATGLAEGSRTAIRAGGRGKALDGAPELAYNQDTIETRGDLPPLAATLNKELKSDSPGGAARPAFLLSATAVVLSRSPVHVRRLASDHAAPPRAPRRGRQRARHEATRRHAHGMHVHGPNSGLSPRHGSAAGGRGARLDRSDTQRDHPAARFEAAVFYSSLNEQRSARRPFTEAPP